MNFFSTILMLTIIALVILPFFIQFKKKKTISPKLMPLLLSAIAFFLVVYLHYGITRGFTFVSPDEDIFLQNLSEFEKNKDIFINHSSGPGAVFFVFWIKQLTGLQAEEVMLLIKLLFSLMIPIVVFVAIKKIVKDTSLAFFAVLVAFFSSHFIWPFMETRPELFGLPIFFGILLMIGRFLKDGENKALFLSIIAISVLAVVHILSMVLASLVFFFCFLFSSKKNKKAWALSVFALIMIVLYILSFAGAMWDIHFAVRESLGWGKDYPSESYYSPPLRLHVLLDGKLKLSFLVLTIIMIPTIVFIALESTLRNTIQRLKLNAKAFVLKNEKNFLWVIAIVIFLVAISQVLFFSAEITAQYRSIFTFFFFQLGNIFFLVLLLLGFFETIKKQYATVKNIFYPMAPLLLLIGFASLTAPFVKVGFHNFALRALNYFIPLAGVLSFAGLKKIFESKVNTRLLFSFMLLFLALSIVIGTRDPSVIKRSGFFETIEVASYTNMDYRVWFRPEIAPIKERYVPRVPDAPIYSNQSRLDKLYSTKKISLYVKND